MAIVKKYKSEIVDIINPAENIFTVEFRSLNSTFKFHPGQFLHLALEEYDPSSAWPDSRCFSIQTSPSENTLKITYAVKGEFTRRMAKILKPGAEIYLKLPYGDLFIKEHNKINTVFIAGGTGITPYLSLITNPSFSEYTNPKIYLGFRSKKYNIYEKELEVAVNLHKSKKDSDCFIETYYEDYEGMLDISKILLKSDNSSTFFISGPPKMINNFKQYLIKNGINENQVRTDDWE